MSFLAPLFLASLAALAVPVIIHLVQRERREVIDFPSLMFLRRIPYRSERRRRLRHWLLLALRCAALVLIAAAFARPLLERRGAVGSAAGGSAREIVILLDRSYSMGYRDRWARAKAAAMKAVLAMREGDRASLVLFDEEAAAVTQPTEDVSVVRSAIETASPGAGITRFAPALRLAGRILSESRLPGARREAILISDFQRAGWRSNTEGDAKLPPGASLVPVVISDSIDSNVAVTALELHRSFVQGREQITVVARLANTGSSGASRDVALELDASKAGSRRVVIRTGGAASVSFDPFPLGEATIRGTVRATADALTADDERHFAVSRGENVSVLLLTGNNGGGRAGRGVHLASALGIGSQPVFRVDRRRGVGALSAAELASNSVVIMDDAASWRTAESTLEEFVKGGGGLIMAAGESAGSWTGASPLLPARIGSIVDRPFGDGGILSELDRSHPVFQPFTAPRSGDFASARFLRYRETELAADARVLARFDDGAPALVERSVGNGRVLLWSSTLDPYWNDLALQPVFLPFVHELVKYVSGYTERPAAFTVGSVIELDQLGGARGWSAGDAGLSIVSPRGARARVAHGAAIKISEPGFYEVRPAARPLATPLVAAANVDASESDLSTIDPREITAAVTSSPASSPSVTMSRDLTGADREKAQGLWRYMLLGALLLLAVESVLSNRLSHARAARVARR